MGSEQLLFKPLSGFSSRHAQTILPSVMPPGIPPPSEPWILELSDQDRLSCQVSTPPSWERFDPTVLLVHGLGGSHTSGYMIRMARKLYYKGFKIVRVNLRGCGSGFGMAKKSHYGGNSQDVLEVLKAYDEKNPDSPLTLIGFSLGGNVSLKLAGELGEKMTGLVKKCIAICPPLDLFESVKAIEKNKFYQNYYLKSLNANFSHKFTSIFDMDHHITAPTWGYKSAIDYYQNCSSVYFIPKIQHRTFILLAEDDPFVNPLEIQKISVPPSVKVYTTKFGGHMGYIGPKGSYWMDELLLDWVED